MKKLLAVMFLAAAVVSPAFAIMEFDVKVGYIVEPSMVQTGENEYKFAYSQDPSYSVGADVYLYLLHNVGIGAGVNYIFDSNLSLEGTWINSSAYPEWFGAKGDGKNDDRMAIQKCINSCEVTHFLNKSYLLNSLTDADKGICINTPEFKTLEGEYVGNAIW